MSVLQYKYLTDEHTWAELIAMTDVYTFNEYLDMMGFREMGNIFYDMSKKVKNGDTYYSALEKAGLSMNVFLGDGEDKIMNFEEMLNEILKYMNLHMIQEGEDFYIFDWKTIENNTADPWTCILKKKLYDNDNNEIPNNTTPVSDITLINKQIGMSDYSSDSTNLSMSEIYNQIQAKCTLATVDSVITSPTDNEDILAYFNKRELFMTEFISYGNCGPQCAGLRLKGMMNGACAYDCYSKDISTGGKYQMVAGYGGWNRDVDNDWELRDWYVQWVYNPNWTMTYKNQDIEEFIDISGQSRYNQQKIMKLLREKDSFPALVAISTMKDAITQTSTANRYPAVLTDPAVYLVISSNGRKNDTEGGADAVNQRNQEAAGSSGLLTYNNLTAANYSPADEDSTNFLVFKGKMILMPLIDVAGWEGWKMREYGVMTLNELQYSRDRSELPNPDVPFGTARDKFNMSNWDRGSVTFDSVDNFYTLGLSEWYGNGGGSYPRMMGKAGEYGYYQRLFWKTEQGAEKETTDPYSIYMYPPEELEEYQQYKYNYTSDGNTNDEYTKFPVLECRLKIGDKYLVEITSGLQKGEPEYHWYTEAEAPYLKDDNGNDTSTKKTTFTLGFDPVIGQPIIGKEYELANTADGRLFKETGTAIPIKNTDNLSGTLEFSIMGLIGTQWTDITRRNPWLFWKTQWQDKMVNIMDHVSSVWIKDFDIEITSSLDAPGVIAETKNKDLLYTSMEERKYIKTRDDIDFKINTQVSSEEAEQLGLSSTAMVSNAVNVDTSTGLEGIYAYGDSSNIQRPEKLYVDQYWNYYHLPKVILETEIHDTSTASYNMMDTYQITGFGKMMPHEVTRDLKKNSVKIKMRQI